MDYKRLVDTYEHIQSATKRLEKTKILSEFLKQTDPTDIESIVLLMQGKIFPSWDDRKTGVATRLVTKAIAKSLGYTDAAIEAEWKRTGDLGVVTENLTTQKKQVTLFSKKLSVNNVISNIRKMSALEGPGSIDRKVALIAELLTSASPDEARYIIRTVLEELRVGIGEGILRDAIVWAFFGDDVKIQYDPAEKSIEPENREVYNKYVDAVQSAYDILNDFAAVAKIAKEQGVAGLTALDLQSGKPVKVMLFQKAINIANAFERVGRPCAVEFKYDGFRMQIHKSVGKILVFTRRLEEVTSQFPEVVEFVKSHVAGDSFILDAEAVGFDPKSRKYLPFQSISQRIKRKYDVEQMSKEFPVEVNVFDLLYHDNKTLIKRPFKARREILERIVTQVPQKIVLARQVVTDNDSAAEQFYQDALKAGEEGVMFKNLDAEYRPGSRVGFGVKVKPTMQSLDLVIVGAEWGEGKRSGWLTSFVLACKDSDTGAFIEIGRVGTGFKELASEDGVTFDEMTNLLKPLIVEEKGRVVRVKPHIVVEISYEEIQKSPSYSSGYALRFPRLARLREMERSPEDISTLEEVENLYSTQRSR
ncbi:ATP-dependent DNA ligase [Candidatus Woesearchaeota archaeon]|nr:ATP-dependent DNA ligase [Candidatus Woesearchaeota archaeon]